MAKFDVGFRVNGSKGSTTEARVEANDSREAERKVIDRYSQPIEIVYVRKV